MKDFKSLVKDRSTLFTNGAIFDPFGRARVSEAKTLWSSKLLGDNRAIFWDDQEVSGSGTGSSYLTNESAVSLSVSDATAGKRVRQSFQRFNYQSGKGHQMDATFVFGAADPGITRAIGYFDDKNGIFLKQDGDGLHIVKRSYATGSAVDTEVSEANWNLSLASGLPSIDPTKAHILIIDFQWLGVGVVRVGFNIDGATYWAHQFNHANVIDSVYMTTPNLPVRYEIENDGTGGAATMKAICSTVISDGGQEVVGQTTTLWTVPTHVDASTANTEYAVIGIRLKSTHLDNVAKIVNLSMLNEGNTDFAWRLLLNPTVAGTFTYGDVANSPIQAAYGVTANTVSGGTPIEGNLSTSSSVSASIVDNLRYLGSAIDGTPDTIVLTVIPLSANADIQAAMTVQFE